MPRWIKKIIEAPVQVENNSEPVTSLSGQIIVADAATAKEDNVVNKKLTPVEESRKVLKVPLQAGQCFFESPEGFIEIGEKNRHKVWCRAANGGKGMWINPMR